VVVQVVIDELPEIAVLLVDDQDLVRSGLRPDSAPAQRVSCSKTLLPRS
jgi:hypothetical protein